MTAAFERRDEQTRRLLDRQRRFALAHHVHEKRHRPVHGATGQRIDVLDQQALVRVLRKVAMLLEQLAHRVVAVDVHRR